MKSFVGKALRWEWREGVIDLRLDYGPANEIGTVMLAELEKFVAAFPALIPETAACIISSCRKPGFSAGADLRELYRGAERLPEKDRLAEVRSFSSAFMRSSTTSIRRRSRRSRLFTASVLEGVSNWLSPATSS